MIEWMEFSYDIEVERIWRRISVVINVEDWRK